MVDMPRLRGRRLQRLQRQPRRRIREGNLSQLPGGDRVSRTKQIPFEDSLAIWAETVDEQRVRDGVNMLAVYARQRKFAFRIRIEAAPVEKALPLLDQEKK
jgi:hypothetical protein